MNGGTALALGRCLLLLLLVALLNAGAALAEEFNIGPERRLLAGYDPVSYFEAPEPERGVRAFRLVRDGVEILFASDENRARFLADPEHYLPAYGGYCSFGVRMGQRLGVDPLAYRIVDDRLFLQHDPGTQRVWRMSERRNIAIADRVWPQIAEPTAAPE
ncbi:MAG: YHS domain-containing (seleno)protein [Pseudomonadota bacterium]